MLRLGRHSFTGPSLGSWPVLLCLALGVLTPSAALLWFMNRAVQNEQFAVRQKLIDAYRVQVILLAAKVQSFWETKSDALRLLDGMASPEIFQQAITSSLADGVVIREPPYPDLLQPSAREMTIPGWETCRTGNDFLALAGGLAVPQQRAFAIQAAARAFRSARQTNEALAALLRLAGPEFEDVTDLQGRLLAPNADLAALELLPRDDSRFTETLTRLRQRIDYARARMRSAQRRFLSSELAALTGEPARFHDAETISTHAAARLDWDESGVQINARPAWIAFKTNGVALLFHSTNLVRLLEQSVREAALSQGTEFRVLAGTSAEDFLASVPIPDLPGWQIAARPANPGEFDRAAEQQIAAYIWAGLLVVAAVALLSLLAARVLLRQARLTRLKNDLLANVTHELKTPLASTRLLVDTLLDSPDVTDQTTREYLELIARENRRLGNLIENFLAFSRLERNKSSFDFRPIAAARILHQAADAVREKFAVSGTEFSLDAPDDLPMIRADADSLATALINLLENAFKYTGEKKRIILRGQANDGQVFLGVADNGMGIPARELKKIFRRFYQIDQSLSRKTGGCGLGLSIVEFIVQAHGGEITVHSTPGQGSTFTISLPSLPARVEKDQLAETLA